MLSTVKNFNLRYLFRNLSYLFTRDLAADMRQPEFRREILYQQILRLPEPLASIYRDEMDYLRRAGLTAFPYDQIRSMDPVESGRDSEKNLPFVIHRGKRLYFPDSWTELQATEAYRCYFENECLLGGGYRVRTPHQYQTDEFCVRPGDVVVDVGAAEGLFALEVVELASRIILFECDSIWRKPLEATFAPYASKVQIIHKKADTHDGRRSVRLNSFLLQGADDESFFIKMDIEGAEPQLVEDCRSFLVQASQVRLCACSYHRWGDAEQLERLLVDMGYDTDFSDGYMLFTRDLNQAPPFFRRGLIRAEKMLR